MKFIESNVFTSVNAADAKVGSIGYVADSMGELKRQKASQILHTLTGIRTEDHQYRFLVDGNTRLGYNLFYLVKEAEKEKLCTHRELARWLAQGKGEKSFDDDNGVYMEGAYRKDDADKEVNEHTLVRKWSDEAWYKPTKAYMGIE